MDWLFTYKKALFNVDGALNDLKRLDWSEGNKVSVGDYAYLYSGVPEQCVKYKCLITRINKTADFIDDSKYRKTLPENTNDPYFEIELEYKFKKPIPLNDLAKYGMSKKRVNITSAKKYPEMFQFFRQYEQAEKETSGKQKDFQKKQEKKPIVAYKSDIQEKKEASQPLAEINIPRKPFRIATVKNMTYVICARCKRKFIHSPRCPECGQLQKYED